MAKPERNIAYLLQGGLGMPDRDFYLEGGRMAEMRTAYQAHVAKVLGLAGIADAEAKAARILALETAIARVHATQVETNDVKLGNNPWARADFDAKAPGMDWTAFLDGAQLGEQATIVVWQPKATVGISKLVATQPLETWKDYLAFHALDSASGVLPKAFVDERFAFYGTKMSGTPQMQERWKRAVGAVDGALGDAVGKIYVQRHFTPQTKARADELVKNLLAAFDKRIDNLGWMTPQTKARAKAKLAGLKIGMGYPAVWADYSTLEVRADDALGNAERASLFEYQRNLAKLGQPSRHDDWYMLAQEVNALNIPLENRLVFPAAILDAPFFDGAADDAVNYGAIGSVIGHEISHSFDSSGALFDENGKMQNWWTPEDLKRFEEACKALAAQYDGYEPFPGVHVNGKLTLGENTADNGGIRIAFLALQNTLAQEGKKLNGPKVDGFTPAQRFFIGFGQVWCENRREQYSRMMVKVDPHSPGKFRVNGTVQNFDEFGKAFNCKKGSPMYPEHSCRVW
jgi:putative endopeptidase